MLAQVVVATPPTANFTHAPTDLNPAGACQTVTFTDTSSDLETDIQSITFDFGDGTSFTGPPGSTVPHSYATGGAKSVTLTATDADTDPDADGPLLGDGVEVGSTTQSVPLASAPPTAAISPFAQNPVDPGLVATFEGSGTDDGRVATYQWDFDGNATFEPDATATGPSVTHTFDTSGPKPIRFRTLDNCGQASAVDSETLVVTDSAPIASISADRTITLQGLPVTLTATASDVGGAVTLYEWDLNGNGTYNEAGEPSGATVNEVQAAFATSGSHRVNVRVTDNSTPAKMSVAQYPVWVNFPPKVDFTFNPAPPLIGDPVTFRLTRAEDDDGSIARYQWDLDGNGVYETEGPTPAARSYATAGARSVHLRVTDNDGSQATVTKSLAVGSNVRPVASFRISPARPLENQSVTFASTSDDPDDRLTKQEWDFNGDGRYEAQGRVVSRKFKRGNRRVVLRVTDSRGATATRARTFVVRTKPLRQPPDVDSTVSYLPRQWGITLTRFTVQVPSKTSLAVRCSGSGCPRGTFRRRSTKKAALLTFSGLTGILRAGAKISIIITRPGHLTGWDTITVRGGASPDRAARAVPAARGEAPEALPRRLERS